MLVTFFLILVTFKYEESVTNIDAAVSISSESRLTCKKCLTYSQAWTSGKLEVGCENGKFLQSCNQSYGDELNQLMTKLEAYMYSKEEAQMDLKNQLALVNQYAGFRGR